MSSDETSATEEFAWEWRCKGTGDPDGMFSPWRAVTEGRIEVSSPYSSHFEFRRVSARFANYFTQCEKRSGSAADMRCRLAAGHASLHNDGLVNWA